MIPRPEIREADSDARRSVLEERVRNVAIEASAGTGKTQLLTDRLMGFLADGTKMDSVVVVTFTKAAAAELRARIRRGIQEGGLPPALAMEQRKLLPAAVIDTIHGFASGILRRFSHIAGIDPGFTVSGSFIGRRTLARRWDEYLSGLEKSVVERNLALICSIREDMLDSLGRLAALPDWFTGRECVTSGTGPERLDVRWWRARIDSLEQEAASRTGRDPLGDWVDEAVPVLRASLTEPIDLKRIGPAFSGAYRTNMGSARNWPGEAKRRVHEIASDIRNRMAADLLTGQFAEVCLPFVSSLREERAAERSRLSYDDLLWKCRDMFSENDDLRAEVLSGIGHVFIDEFQDTSTIQADLFRRLLEDGGGRLPEGRLTIVGDRKQSIFGWLDADLPSYISLSRRMQDQGALVAPISVNFRSTSTIIRFVNAIGPHVFPTDDGNLPPDECAYSGLDPRRGAELGRQVRVVFFPEDLDARQRRLQEADWLARSLIEWRRAEGEHGWAVIVPARTDIEIYLAALTAHGLPFELDSTRDFTRRLEVADIASLLRVLACPSDLEAMVAVLRSTLFGTPDTEITASLSGGLRDFLRPPGGIPEGVARACAMLAGLRLYSLSAPPSRFLHQLLGRSSIAGVIAASGHDVPRRLANLQYLFDFTASDGGASLAALSEMLAEEEPESGLEEPRHAAGDSSTVTVTTIHGSKGLQYRHVVLLPSQGGNRSQKSVAFSERERLVGIRLPGWEGSAAFLRIAEARAARDQAEHKRLLYVALTRAERSLTVITNRNSHAGPLAKVFNEAFDAMYREDPGCVDLVEVEPAAPSPPRREAAPLPEAEEDSPPFTPPDVGFSPRPSPPLLLGSCVHAVMEKIDFGDPGCWLDGHLASMSLPPDAAVDEVRRLAEAFFAIPDLPFVPGRDRIAGREFPVVFRGTDGPEEQYVDLLVESGDSLVAIDYKTDSVTAEDMDAAVSGHAAKQTSYGTHLAGAFGKRVAVYIAFLRPGIARLVGEFGPDPGRTGGSGTAEKPGKRSGRA